MPDYKQNDIEKMQRDAEQRIREMQKRADRTIRGSDMPPVPNFVRLNHGHQPDKVQDNSREQDRGQNRSSQSNTSDRRQNGRGQTSPHGDRRQTAPNDRPTAANRQQGGILSRFKGLDILKIFNFQNIRLDSDVLVIIALIFLLSTEETDELLMMALIYIML